MVNKENTELLIGGVAIATLIGGGIVLMDRDTCIKKGGTWKFPFGPCTLPGPGTTTAQQACQNSGGTWDSNTKTCTCPNGYTLDTTSGACVAVSPSAPTPPATVSYSNVQATGQNSWTADVSCPPVTGTTSYKWFIDDTAVGTTPGPSGTVQGTGPGQQHTIGVAACN